MVMVYVVVWCTLLYLCGGVVMCACGACAVCGQSASEEDIVRAVHEMRHIACVVVGTSPRIGLG